MLLPLPDLVANLKAAAETTRLRILILLSKGEMTVKDLTLVLGQSQPRISRHLKLLTESRLVDRFRDGSFVYFHVSERSEGGALVRRILEKINPFDPLLRRDLENYAALKSEQESTAQSYFLTHASDWDRLRSLYVSEKDVERAMLSTLGRGPFNLFVDIGTGTGRILQLFAKSYKRGLGFDINKSMLAYARSKLSTHHVKHAEVRHGDLYHLSLPDGIADAVVLHQVLHYLSDPQAALLEVKRILSPKGRLLIIDFAPHNLEILRERHAHKRLGIAPDTMDQWIKGAGLSLNQTKTLFKAKKDQSTSLTVQLWLAQLSNDNKGQDAHSTNPSHLREEHIS
ncbi:MAG: ArsR/SmtB family transcription factor [Hyphomicrobium sp.]